MSIDIKALFAEREAERYALHTRYMNEQMVRVLKTIGYDTGFVRGKGQYLWDREGAKYLDLLSGFGVFAIGRNHPRVHEALRQVLDSEFPNLIQMDVSPLAGILAERLLARVPHLEKVFFANSGTESVEAAIKFARAATGRPGIAHCSHAFHGLTYGALSMNGDTIFRKGFEGFLTDCVEVPFNDLAALEDVLKTKKIGGFFVEPIQGKGVNIPDDGYLKGVAELCHKYGTLFIADEIQTGVGRTGKFLAVEHWGVEPDVVLLAKALSGGHIPVGVVLTRKWIFDKLFNRMDRAVVHGSTFSKNDMAMAAGLATLDVLDEEHVIENAAVQGERLLSAFRAMKDRYELVKDVRGKGAHDRRRVRRAEIHGAQDGLGRGRGRQQGAVLPDDHHPAVQGPQNPGAGRGPREPYHQAPAAAHHHRARIAPGSRTPSRPPSPRRIRCRARCGRSARRSPGMR